MASSLIGLSPEIRPWKVINLLGAGGVRFEERYKHEVWNACVRVCCKPVQQVFVSGLDLSRDVSRHCQLLSQTQFVRVRLHPCRRRKERG